MGGGVVERKVGLGLSLYLDFTLNYFSDGITLITKDEASGSSVTAEEAKKVLPIFRSVHAWMLFS